MAVLPSNLPVVAYARLPAAYEQAKHALAECTRVDECKGWADKAAAIASYARQSKDDSLEKMAMRIRARAVRGCGELLMEIDPAPGRPSAEEKLGRAPTPISRKDAAREAGLSSQQQKTALRVARVPELDFERAVDSATPPTVTALARLGKKPAPGRNADPQGTRMPRTKDTKKGDVTVTRRKYNELIKLARTLARLCDEKYELLQPVDIRRQSKDLAAMLAALDE